MQHSFWFTYHFGTIDLRLHSRCHPEESSPIPEGNGQFRIGFNFILFGQQWRPLITATLQPRSHETTQSHAIR